MLSRVRASAGSRYPCVTSAAVAASHFFTNAPCVGYRSASLVALNGTVVPKIPQRACPETALVLAPALPCAGGGPGWPTPESLATGAATCGDRIPPSALPLASWRKAWGFFGFTSRRGDCWGARPVSTHVLTACTAARSS